MQDNYISIKKPILIDDFLEEQVNEKGGKKKKEKKAKILIFSEFIKSLIKKYTYFKIVFGCSLVVMSQILAVNLYNHLIS